jgi:hypothetical protein
MKFHVSAAVIMIAMCATANAQSLKDKEYFASQEKYLAEKVPDMNKKCDTNVAVKFDWSKPPSDRSYSASGYCEPVLYAMERVCDTPAGKDAVKQKIKSLTCGFGAQRTIAIKDGAIDYQINYGSVNDADFVFEYLQNNL